VTTEITLKINAYFMKGMSFLMRKNSIAKSSQQPIVHRRAA
jgi:hypothetical protein